MTRLPVHLLVLAPLVALAEKPNVLFIIADDQAPRSIDRGSQQSGDQDAQLG
ncbi:MAG: hypothetical protein O3A82_02745 [Verrucomicrobia bacterium]|nr:hypothetical protein [Verrucomicrobiota bacterium]MDA1045827.1 hypothetical protein [Verrucomicrobiota bacterium]